MLAAARAELLVLRKWPAVWGLLLVMPALALLGYYLLDFVLYLTVTPAQYATQGSPAQLLPVVLPDQFVIVSVQLFVLSNVVPFVVLGAVLAGGDWGRGTIATSLLAGTGRIRAGAGQALALAIAVTASVAATFAVSAAASLVLRAVEAKAVTPLDGALPPAWVLVRAIGAALLVALTYAAIGWFLGTACRSAAGAMGVALVYTVLIEPAILGLGFDYLGPLQKISDFLPGTSAITVTSLFGTVGGGPTSQNYLPDRPAIAAWALAACAAAFVALSLVLLRRRDVLAGRFRRRRPRRPARGIRQESAPTDLIPAAPRPRRAGGLVAPVRAGGLVASVRAGGLVASVRAELLVMRHRPVLWWLVLATPVNMLIAGYLIDYAGYQSAGNGNPATGDVSAFLMLPSVLPVQYLTTALSGLSTISAVYGGLDGPAVLFLLGALVAGSDWGRGTVTTALLAGPGRLATRIGQDLAVLAAAATGMILTFVLAAVTAAGFAAALGGTAPPADTRFPAAGQVTMAVAGGLLVAMACAAIGLALGTILRSATKAAAAVLLWAVLVIPYLDQIGGQVHGVLLHLYEILPDAAINTVVNLDNPNTVSLEGTVVPPSGVLLTPALAFATLALYVVAALAIAGAVTRRRTIA